MRREAAISAKNELPSVLGFPALLPAGDSGTPTTAAPGGEAGMTGPLFETGAHVGTGTWMGLIPVASWVSGGSVDEEFVPLFRPFEPFGLVDVPFPVPFPGEVPLFGFP